VTEDDKEERGIARNFKRPQDFLMPGLRHAHTLQQLKEINTLLFLSDVLFRSLLFFVSVGSFLVYYVALLLIKYSPGGEYSLTSLSCCSV